MGATIVAELPVPLDELPSGLELRCANDDGGQDGPVLSAVVIAVVGTVEPDGGTLSVIRHPM